MSELLPPNDTEPGQSEASPRFSASDSASPLSLSLVPSARAFFDEQRSARRVLNVGRCMVVLMSLGMLLLLGRVAQLQQQPGENLTKLLDAQVTSSQIAARRGAMVDRRGRPLATTRIAYKLFADPALIDEPATFSETVGYTVGLEPVEIEMKLAERRDKRYVVLAEQLTDEQVDQARSLKLKAIGLEPVLVREYPQGPLAGHLIGFTGAEGKGLDGLERVMDKTLAGEPGQYAVLRDNRRGSLWFDSTAYVEHADGKPVRLTIDVSLQEMAERELVATVNQFQAVAGQMIVMDPRNGQILAMANYPPFDPNDFRTVAPEGRRNRCVTDVFEPGSIFKPFVWAAMLQAGIATPDEAIDCTTQGWWKPARGPILRDAHAQGLQTYDGVLVTSSNIGMGKVVERAGPQKLYEWVSSYGFGQVTGSGLPGELPGISRDVKTWSATDLTRIPIGQAIAVTPLQLVRAMSAIANDGLLITPRLILPDDQPLGVPVSYSNTHPTLSDPTLATRVLSPEVASHTRQVLRRAVTEGTGRKANSKLYDLFGKTGTAQLPNPKNRGYLPDGYVSSFLAGAPVDQPRLVVGCFIHQPDKKIGHYGGTVAAPGVMRFMEQALAYLGIPPNGPKDIKTASRLH